MTTPVLIQVSVMNDDTMIKLIPPSIDRMIAKEVAVVMKMIPHVVVVVVTVMIVTATVTVTTAGTASATTVAVTGAVAMAATAAMTVTAVMTGTAVTTGIVAADAGTIGAGMMTGVGMMTGGAVAKIGGGRMTGSGAAVGRMTAGRSERSPARDRERSLQKSPGRRAQRRVMMKMSPKGSVLQVKMNIGAKMRKRWIRTPGAQLLYF